MERLRYTFFESMRRLKGEQQDTLIALLPYNLQMTPILEITDPVGETASAFIRIIHMQREILI